VDEYGFSGSSEEHEAAAKIQTSFRKRSAAPSAVVDLPYLDLLDRAAAVASESGEPFSPFLRALRGEVVDLHYLDLLDRAVDTFASGQLPFLRALRGEVTAAAGDDFGFTGSAEEHVAAAKIQRQLRARSKTSVDAGVGVASHVLELGYVSTDRSVDEYGFSGSSEEHEAAAKIQTSFRKRSAAPSAVEGAPSQQVSDAAASFEGTAEEEAAAAKIQAMKRGKDARAQVEAMKQGAGHADSVPEGLVQLKQTSSRKAGLLAAAAGDLPPPLVHDSTRMGSFKYGRNPVQQGGDEASDSTAIAARDVPNVLAGGLEQLKQSKSSTANLLAMAAGEFMPQVESSAAGTGFPSLDVLESSAASAAYGSLPGIRLLRQQVMAVGGAAPLEGTAEAEAAAGDNIRPLKLGEHARLQVEAMNQGPVTGHPHLDQFLHLLDNASTNSVPYTKLLQSPVMRSKAPMLGVLTSCMDQALPGLQLLQAQLRADPSFGSSTQIVCNPPPTSSFLPMPVSTSPQTRDLLVVHPKLNDPPRKGHAHPPSASLGAQAPPAPQVPQASSPSRQSESMNSSDLQALVQELDREVSDSEVDLVYNSHPDAAR